MKRTIGVVIPVFNGAEFIGQALASVAGQRCAPDLVVVVDDGSTDTSAAIARSWQGLLPLTVVSHDRNKGLAEARRTGIAHLTTDAVALLDADDVWLPDHLEALGSLFEARGALVTPLALRWVPGAALGRAPMSGWAIPAPESQLEAMIIMNFVFSGSMFSRDDYEMVGGFRNGFPGVEDWDLWLRLLLAGVRVVAPSCPTVLYRVHDKSMSADDACLDDEISVLNDFAGRAPEGLQPVINQSIRHRRARLTLRRGYEDAREGHLLRARVNGMRALLGPRGVRIRGIALAAAPRWTVQRRDSQRLVPEHLVT